jgi:hypothetical protein
MHAIRKPPLSVTIISCVFLVAGVVAVAYHAREFGAKGPFQYDLLWVCLVRLLAIVCAVFMLRGHNWARWLAVIWLGYHVLLSGFHSISQLVVHGLLTVVITYFLFRSSASAYFLGAKTGLIKTPNADHPAAT